MEIYSISISQKQFTSKRLRNDDVINVITNRHRRKTDVILLSAIPDHYFLIYVVLDHV